MTDDYYIRRINASLEKIEKHLFVIANAFKGLRIEEKEPEDRNNTKEEEE